MKTLVMTVPHSGTHFLLKFLVGVLGLDGDSGGAITAESNKDFLHIHPSQGLDVPDIFDACIITLRHPHLSLTTAAAQGSKNEVMASWESLLERQKKYNKILFLVIDGPDEERLPQLMAIAKHFGKESLEPAIRKYADDWTPVNQTLTDDDVRGAEFAVRAYEQWQL